MPSPRRKYPSTPTWPPSVSRKWIVRGVSPTAVTSSGMSFPVMSLLTASLLEEVANPNAICGGRVFSNHSLVYLRKNSELCRVELRPRPTLPSTHPRFCAYSCAIEVRLMYVCCPFINRTTIEQQSNNNRTTIGQQWKEERRKGLGRMGQKRS